MKNSRRRSITAVLLLTATAPALVAADSEWIAGARQAIAENIPQVAIEKLRLALASHRMGSDERTVALRLLAEAQLNAEQPAAALDTLAEIPGPDDETAVQIRAMALMSLGRWQEALPQFEELGTGEHSLIARAGEAECLQALGRTKEAADVLKPLVASGTARPAIRLRLAALLLELDQLREARSLVESTDALAATDEHWKRYLQARIHLRDKKPRAALAALETLVGGAATAPPDGITPHLRAAATLAEAEAHLAADGPEIAEKILESFIHQNPDSPHVETVFRRLDQIYAMDRAADEGALSRMAAELPPRAAALAQFYLSRVHIRAKRYERADESLKTFLSRFAEDPLTPYVHASLAETAQARGNLAAAEVALDAASRTARTDTLRGELALQTALLNLQQGEFVRASTGFRTAAMRAPALKITAQYDSALAWLRQKNFQRFAEDLAAFTSEFSDRTLTGNLRLEEGLLRARSGDAQAKPALRDFVADFATHPRRAEAQLALAEIALGAGDTAEAEKFQQDVVTADATPEMREEAEYLGVFLEDAKTPRDDDKTISRSRDFIRQYPASAMLGEVRMKLGEVYFRREDYLKAQEQFETLARESPNGPHAVPSLFLAGQCSMKLLNNDSLSRALELFGQVVEKHGPLAPHARLHQAMVKNKLGAPDDAVKIYDSILAAQPPVELELRLAALTGKGDNLVALGRTDAKQFAAAIAAYDQVAAAEGVPPSWRNQASYKKAKTLELQEQRDAALAVLYDILQKAATGPRETFWFGKAGFDAAALVEARQQWKSAIGIYEKMAAIPGPHAELARQRIRKLRLEHFLWD